MRLAAVANDWSIYPDTVFGKHTGPSMKGRYACDTRCLPEFIYANEFRVTTGESLNTSRVVGDSLAALDNVLMSGACSVLEPFLTSRKLEAYCVVVNPLVHYPFWFQKVEPYLSAPFGGLDAKEPQRFYATLWVQVVDDFIRSGNPIFRVEDLPGSAVAFPDFHEAIGPYVQQPKGDPYHGIQQRLEPFFTKLYGDNPDVLYLQHHP